MVGPVLDRWLSFGTAALFLGLALLASRRARESAPARQLTLLSLIVSAYQIAEGTSDVTGLGIWDRLEFALAPIIAWATAGYIMAMLPPSRRARLVLVPVGVYLVALSTLTLTGVVDPTQGPDSPGPWRYAVAMLCILGPGSVALFWPMFRLTTSTRGIERLKFLLLFTACTVGVLGGATDLLAMAGLPVPRLSRPAIILSALVFTFLVLQGQLLPSGRVVFIAVMTLSSAAVLAQGVVYAALGTTLGPFLLATSIVIMLLIFGLRPLFSYYSEVQARQTYLTTLGRFTAQMAHDIQNPIASIRGMMQYLVEERRQDRSIDDRVRELELVIEQTRRMESIVETYRRMGRLELQSQHVDLREVVDATAAAARSWPGSPQVRIERRVPAEPVSVEVDPKLVASALENLVRNAWEAIREHGGSAITLELAPARAGAVTLVVHDDGPGMSAEIRHRASDDFFTTKAQGSGLGLSLARRVAEAHGGSLQIETGPGVGTRVALSLPSGSTSRVGGSVGRS